MRNDVLEEEGKRKVLSGALGQDGNVVGINWRNGKWSGVAGAGNVVLEELDRLQNAIRRLL